MTIYEQLKKAAGMADVIEAAECGYVALDNKSIRHLNNQLMDMILQIALDNKSIRHLNNQLMDMILQISAEQFKKLSGAATPETDETH